MDWSLLGCGRSGHVTFAPDEPELREQLRGDTAGGDAWRCLRCAAFVPGAPDGHGPARDAPPVRRGKEVRSSLILRIFAVERFIRALAFLGLAYGLWRFRTARQSISATFNRELPALRELFSQLGYQIDHSKLVGLVQHALTLSSQSITLLALGLAAYAAVEVIEGTGLWLARRWGEYFAMIATSVGLPLEIYDLAKKVTVTTLIFFAVNLALVLYLVLTKRLFGARGGKHAYEARLRSESVLEAAAEAAAARAADGGGGADGADGLGGADGPGGADGASRGPSSAGGAEAPRAASSSGGADGAEAPRGPDASGIPEAPEAAGDTGDAAAGPGGGRAVPVATPASRAPAPDSAGEAGAPRPGS